MRSSCWRLPMVKHLTVQRIYEFIVVGWVCRTKNVEATGQLLTDLFESFQVETHCPGNNLTREGSPGHARGLQNSLLLMGWCKSCISMTPRTLAGMSGVAVRVPPMCFRTAVTNNGLPPVLL